MAKTRRDMEADIKLVDAVCEIADARIPKSSRNPDLAALSASKPRIVVLNRRDLADPNATAEWKKEYEYAGIGSIETDAKTGAGTDAFAGAVKKLLAEKLEGFREKGMVGREVKLMVVGVPNVGKSTFINRIAGRAVAKAEDRPGVTRSRQWITTPEKIDLLDTPGMLWPKFEDRSVAYALAFTGAVRDDILDLETLASYLCAVLKEIAPDCLEKRYKLTLRDEPCWETLERIGKTRGFLISRGEVDLGRTSRMLLDEFRGGKLGRITLERSHGRSIADIIDASLDGMPAADIVGGRR